MNAAAVTPEERAQRTFRFERWRAVCAGMLEAAGSTFLLLIAVKHLQAGATAKALVASGGSVGLLLSPLVVSAVERLRWPVALAASRLAAFGAFCFLVMAVFPILPVFVVGAVLSMAAASSAIPLLTQMYQENYPERERGKLFSKTVMLRIAAAAIFSEIAGRWLGTNGWRVQGILLVFALAFAGASMCLVRCPSSPLAHTGRRHPFKGLQFAREDVIFRQTLIGWMLMGFANLMMLPLRVEYLANPKYGLAMTTAEVAFLTGVLPNAARLMMSPVWGVLFDRMNFFVLRIVLNFGFALGILAFFTSDGVSGLILGAIIYGVSNAGGDVAWSLWVTKFAPPERVADYMSVHTFFTGIRGVIAPLAAFHLISRFSPGALGIFSIILILLANVWLLPEIKVGRRSRPGSALVEEVSE